ncbi:MAG: BCCT family transporter [Clostridia bacterium]|nr:BCCT family transporter [Clostridia bacterium]
MGKNLENIDKKVLFISVSICVLFVLWTMGAPEYVSGVLDNILSWCLTNLGWYFLLSLAGYLAFLFILAFSKYGKIKLGKDDEKPEYSTGSWIAMTFSCGMGIGLVFWSVAEPMMHFASNPLADSNTAEAARVGMRYVFFHWGLHPWAIYGFIGLPIAYFAYRKGLPALVSSTLYPIIGEKGVKGPIGKAVDILAILVTLFGVANSLGLGAMQINSGLNFLYGIPQGNTVAIAIIAILSVLFIIAAVSGVEKGIKWFGNANVTIAGILMAFVFLAGPTLYIINLFTESIGGYLQNILGSSFFLDTQGTVAKHAGFNWVESWTIFYWVWWIMYGPFCGMFFARVSKGRTIKEFVLGTMIAPVILSFMWLAIFGGTALHIDLFGAGGIAEAVARDITSAIFVTLSHLPLAEVLSILVITLICTFYVTSADSAIFVVGMLCSKGALNPKNGIKIVLGIVEGSIAAMLLLAGGLKAVQTVSFIFGTPFTIVMLFMVYSFMKTLRKDPSLEIKSAHTKANFKAAVNNQ